MSLMHYDMEADWILLQTCNYRCAYCFAPPELLGEKLQPVATPAEWRSALDRTGHTWLLHLTGGEPSIYPRFVDLCEILTERHFMSLNSNLTNASIAEFATRIDPARVNFINAGFHLEERERRSGHAVFLRHAATLQDAGFAVLVSIVATPSVLERYDDAVSILAPLGIVPIPKLFRGVENGKTYPQDYTALDRTRFSQAANHARASYASRLAQMSERPTIDIFRDDAFLSGEPVFTGEMCDAGSKLVRIAPNGDVSRCGPPNLGNLLAGTFKPMRRAAPCDTKFCYYFCEKYTATARVSATTAVRRSGFVGRFFRSASAP